MNKWPWPYPPLTLSASQPYNPTISLPTNWAGRGESPLARQLGCAPRDPWSLSVYLCALQMATSSWVMRIKVPLARLIQRQLERSTRNEVNLICGTTLSAQFGRSFNTLSNCPSISQLLYILFVHHNRCPALARG